MDNFQSITGSQTPFYVFYADEFIANYQEFVNTFREIYPKYQLAYSFKTNYVPAVCKLVMELGGYAEVVSDMEYRLARKIGFPDGHIIYNGPGKGELMETCVLNHGLLNLDNMSEVDRICELADIHKHDRIDIGIRVNFDIGNGICSRFGIDAEGGELKKVLDRFSTISNIRVQGLHFHISQARGVDAWRKRVGRILEIIDEYFADELSYIDIGSGMFGNMDEEMKKQFENVPSYQDYADVVAKEVAEHYKEIEESKKPILFTEPGATVISKYFHLFASVLDIKKVRHNDFALLDCSIHNAGETCKLKTIPVRNLTKHNKEAENFNSIDLVGYTCLEHDILRHNYSGHLARGDLLEFYNVGGYSVVFKPPFIHPDIPIYMLKSGEMTCIKRMQTFEDIFAPYNF